jgi:hypothetical protein
MFVCFKNDILAESPFTDTPTANWFPTAMAKQVQTAGGPSVKYRHVTKSNPPSQNSQRSIENAAKANPRPEDVPENEPRRE